MSIVIKPFSTAFGKYLYDRETNSILTLTSDEYDVFIRIYEGKATESDYDVLALFQERGYCKESQLTSVKHPMDQMVEYFLDNRIEKITLQVTQNCNLRCSYCAYSGMYNQRSHSNRSMPYDIMEKSIDFLMNHSINSPKVDIGFYGGEPLLEFQKIIRIVEYINTKYKNKELTFSLTTNGTLFTDEKIIFLAEHNFNVLVSLDGPKELHNKNRVFVNGEGSFDKMMENLIYIKENYPDFFKKISFNTVVAPGNDYKCTSDFFDANELIEDNTLNASTLSEFSNKEEIQYDDLYFIAVRIQQLKMFLSALGYISKDKVSKLFAKDIGLLNRFYIGLGNISNLTPVAHPGGPCIPGARRPMIDVNGNIFPCERVSEEYDCMKIGNVDTGFEIEKVRAILNIGEITEDKCLNCWNFIHCGLCAASAADLQLSKSKRANKCEGAKNHTLSRMKAVCLLKENNYMFRGDEQYV